MAGKTGPKGPRVTPEQFKQMALWIGMGLTVTEVCRLSVISRDTFYKWVKEGKHREDPQDPVRQFSDAVHRGKLSAKAHALVAVQYGMKKDWKAAAWYLGVTYPRDFGPKVRVTLDQEFGNAISNLEEDFADTPDLLAKVLASLSREPRGRGDAALGPAEPEDSPGTDPEPT